MGNPQVTMGFNAQMAYFWMIWGVFRGYPALETSICQEMLAVPGGCPLQLSEEDSRSGSLDQIC